MNIFEKMAAITAELQGKSLETERTDSRGNTYKVTLEEPVVTAVKELESKHGIYSYPSGIQRTDAVLKRSFVSEGGMKKVYEVNKVDVVLTYRFVNTENPEESIEVPGVGTGIDYGDKAPGKAYTYACKYALMKAYKIPSGGKASADDPDAVTSEMADAMVSVEVLDGGGYVPTIPFENPLIPTTDSTTPAADNFEANVAKTDKPEDELPADGIPVNAAQARKIVCSAGKYKGKTFGEIFVMDDAEKLFAWYEGKNKPKAELAAAKILLMEKRN